MAIDTVQVGADKENEETARQKVKYHNFCLRCGRRLKADDTRIRGYGNVCWEKVKRSCTTRLF